MCAVEDLEKKVGRAVKDKILQSQTLLEQIEEAASKGVLNKDEAKRLKEAELCRQQVIAKERQWRSKL